MDGVGGVLDQCLWLRKVEAGVHNRYREHLRFLAQNIDRLPPGDRGFVVVLLRQEGWLDDGND